MQTTKTIQELETVLEKHPDKMKIIYGWVKQGTIGLTKFKALVSYVQVIENRELERDMVR